MKQEKHWKESTVQHEPCNSFRQTGVCVIGVLEGEQRMEGTEKSSFRNNGSKSDGREEEQK